MADASNILGVIGVRRKRPTRFVIPAGSARIDGPDGTFGIPGMLGSSAAKLRRIARFPECGTSMNGRPDRRQSAAKSQLRGYGGVMGPCRL